jgi:hypothetical protein
LTELTKFAEFLNRRSQTLVRRSQLTDFVNYELQYYPPIAATSPKIAATSPEIAAMSTGIAAMFPKLRTKIIVLTIDSYQYLKIYYNFAL